MKEVLAIAVAPALPRIDRREVRWPGSGDAPLDDREVGDSGHAHFAVAPRLLRRPLDEVVAVLALLLAEDNEVALGHPGAARVGIDDGIPTLGPPHRVWPLPNGVFGDRISRHVSARE